MLKAAKEAGRFVSPLGARVQPGCDRANRRKEIGRMRTGGNESPLVSLSLSLIRLRLFAQGHGGEQVTSGWCRAWRLGGFFAGWKGNRRHALSKVAWHLRAHFLGHWLHSCFPLRQAGEETFTCHPPPSLLPPPSQPFPGLA